MSHPSNFGPFSQAIIPQGGHATASTASHPVTRSSVNSSICSFPVPLLPPQPIPAPLSVSSNVEVSIHRRKDGLIFKSEVESFDKKDVGSVKLHVFKLGRHDAQLQTFLDSMPNLRRLTLVRNIPQDITMPPLEKLDFGSWECKSVTDVVFDGFLGSPGDFLVAIARVCPSAKNVVFKNCSFYTDQDDVDAPYIASLSITATLAPENFLFPVLKTSIQAALQSTGAPLKSIRLREISSGEFTTCTRYIYEWATSVHPMYRKELEVTVGPLFLTGHQDATAVMGCLHAPTEWEFVLGKAEPPNSLIEFFGTNWTHIAPPLRMHCDYSRTFIVTLHQDLNGVRVSNLFAQLLRLLERQGVRNVRIKLVDIGGKLIEEHYSLPVSLPMYHDTVINN